MFVQSKSNRSPRKGQRSFVFTLYAIVRVRCCIACIGPPSMVVSCPRHLAATVQLLLIRVLLTLTLAGALRLFRRSFMGNSAVVSESESESWEKLESLERQLKQATDAQILYAPLSCSPAPLFFASKLKYIWDPH